MWGKVGLIRDNILFRRIIYAAFVSSLGDWFNSIAVITLVLTLTHSSLAVGVTLAMRVIPYLIAGPIGGVLSDRLRRTQVMIACDLIRSVLALGFLFVLRMEDIWLLYVLSTTLVFFSAFYGPARSAYLSSIVKKENIGIASSITTGLNGIAMILGFSLAGITIAEFGVSIAFVFNAFSFIFSAFFLVKGARSEFAQYRDSVMPIAKSKNANVDVTKLIVSYWASFKIGVYGITRNKPVAFVVYLFMGGAIGGGAINVLISVMVDQVFGGGSKGLGLLYASLGAGTIVGSFTTERLFKGNHKRMQATVGLTLVLEALFQIFFVNSPNLSGAMLGLIGVGYASALSNAMELTIIASLTPNEIQGRVFSVSETLKATLLGISMMLVGLLTSRVAPQHVGDLGAIIIFCSGLLYTLMYKSYKRKDVEVIQGSNKI
ncbi:arabinose efflux permease family protein [Desulfosporosinus acidiphilus SJ4]|uniref:Arabinose efflux permease family protein n=1 Tax=Desulfosporosinus acidiphilus (strain DSM 22704 / JCM 16185 / SJ4) TaxID=646529 RepID=I4D3P5_DESAJ|nr:arabinose efflux permease family protein [Desulfosporosinus acidiphilus SJ4]